MPTIPTGSGYYQISTMKAKANAAATGKPFGQKPACHPSLKAFNGQPKDLPRFFDNLKKFFSKTIPSIKRI